MHWSAWKKSWNDAVVYVLFSLTMLKSLNLEVSESTVFMHFFFFLGNRFVTYVPVNIKDHYFLGIFGLHFVISFRSFALG